MAAPARHAKPKPRAAKIRPLAAAAATLAGVAAAFVFLQGGPASAGSPSRPVSASSASPEGPALADNMLATMRRTSAASQARASAQRARAVVRARDAARRRLRAERAARQRAQQSPPPAPAPAPSSSPPPTTDAAHSALGICIRDAEEGGSYAWGPGNGGGAYQFLISTWERYGGAASEFGVAGPAYQDRIFDNAIAAGGASNWTAYDGC
jgi:Transglycosylase-like domain